MRGQNRRYQEFHNLKLHNKATKVFLKSPIYFCNINIHNHIMKRFFMLLLNRCRNVLCQFRDLHKRAEVQSTGHVCSVSAKYYPEQSQVHRCNSPQCHARLSSCLVSLLKSQVLVDSDPLKEKKDVLKSLVFIQPLNKFFCKVNLRYFS